jgi:hypothetical protein
MFFRSRRVLLCENEELRARVAALERENSALRTLVAKLEARIAILERQGGSGSQGPKASTLIPKTPPPKPKCEFRKVWQPFSGKSGR